MVHFRAMFRKDLEKIIVLKKVSLGDLKSLKMEAKLCILELCYRGLGGNLKYNLF